MRLGNILSKRPMQEKRVPQSGVPSDSLFLVKLNSITEAKPVHIQYSLYADELQLSVISCNLAICERALQVAINNWRSGQMTIVLLSSRRRLPVSVLRGGGAYKMPPFPIIYNNIIRLTTLHKYLDFIFDSKLTFVPDIKTLTMKR